MSVQDQIDRISGNVASTYSVLESAGATLPDEQNSDNLAATVAAALGSSGGSSGMSLLWSGSWSSGSLTIAISGGSAGCTGLGNISDYKLCAFIDAEGCVFYVYNKGTHILGGGNYYSVDYSYAYAFGFAASLSGNTMSLVANKYGNLSHSSRKVGSAWSPIVEIYGLVKNDDIVTS